eukprot:GHRQ01023353.1.p1 GENE.GHRQ01023353.1~~GHRQ01023353.1.p1  ORF type:complete len:181 (+),score=17.28 GHRQ01023353.1:67-609(+)
MRPPDAFVSTSSSRCIAALVCMHAWIDLNSMQGDGSSRLQVVAGDVTDAASLPAAVNDAAGVIFAASGRGYWSAEAVDNKVREKSEPAHLHLPVVMAVEQLPALLQESSVAALLRQLGVPPRSPAASVLVLRRGRLFASHAQHCSNRCFWLCRNCLVLLPISCKSPIRCCWACCSASQSH